MKTEFCKIAGTPNGKFPLNPSAIPNLMGINLCSVEGMSWTRQDDGQLISLTIHFIPLEKEMKGEWIVDNADMERILRGAPEVLQKEGIINYANNEVVVKSENFDKDVEKQSINN